MKGTRSFGIDISVSISTVVIATLLQVLSYRSISSRFDDSILVNWMVLLTLFSLMPLVYAGAQQRLINRFISGLPEAQLWSIPLHVFFYALIFVVSTIVYLAPMGYGLIGMGLLAFYLGFRLFRYPLIAFNIARGNTWVERIAEAALPALSLFVTVEISRLLGFAFQDSLIILVGLILISNMALLRIPLVSHGRRMVRIEFSRPTENLIRLCDAGSLFFVVSALTISLDVLLVSRVFETNVAAVYLSTLKIFALILSLVSVLWSVLYPRIMKVIVLLDKESAVYAREQLLSLLTIIFAGSAIILIVVFGHVFGIIFPGLGVMDARLFSLLPLYFWSASSLIPLVGFLIFQEKFKMLLGVATCEFILKVSIYWLASIREDQFITLAITVSTLFALVASGLFLKISLRLWLIHLACFSCVFLFSNGSHAGGLILYTALGALWFFVQKSQLKDLYRKLVSMKIL